MKNFSYKYKIIIALIGFVLFAFGMFFYGYTIFDTRNEVLAEAAIARRLELEMLQREQRSFEQGSKDLAAFALKPYPPEDFFSKDTKVVKEIRTLEQIAARFNLNFSLAIAGSAKTAIKVPSIESELYIIPYTATVRGSFENIHKYFQEAEHLPFATHTKTINISADVDGGVRGVFSSEFYIKK